MKEKRLIQKAQSVQVNTITPVRLDNPDFHKYPTETYTNYGSYAWITPAEAQIIIDVFGRQYVLEGAKEGTYYINPKYMDAEVEALIWRTRGSTPLEGHDKGTYASLTNKLALDVKEVDYYNWQETESHLNNALQCCTKAIAAAPKLSPDKVKVCEKIANSAKEIKKVTDMLQKENLVTAFDYSSLEKAVEDKYVKCPKCTMSGSDYKHIIDKQENNYYHKNDFKCEHCGHEYQVARVAFIQDHFTKMASQMVLRNCVKDLNILFKAPSLDKHAVEEKLKLASNQSMDSKTNSIIKNLLELLHRGSEDSTLRSTFKNLKQVVWPELP